MFETSNSDLSKLAKSRGWTARDLANVLSVRYLRDEDLDLTDVIDRAIQRGWEKDLLQFTINDKKALRAVRVARGR